MKHFVLICLALFPIAHFCHKQTDGFALTKVSTCLLQEAASDANELPATTYRYLGKGGQSYVFISEDGCYVLKLLRSSRLNTLQFFHQMVPLAYLKKEIQKQEALIQTTLRSYALALSQLKEETGLVAAHLDVQHSSQSSLKIIDKVGIAHIIDPNRYPFVIQKRAVLVKEKVGQLITSQNPQAARQIFKSLFSLLQVRLNKGIEDHDPNLAKNFGFCGDQPIQIDTGRFDRCQAPTLDKIAKSKEDLQHWINLYYPELSQDLHQAYEDFLNEF